MNTPHYDEKTGDPAQDNFSRKWNKRLRRASMTLRLDTPGGRRRKKYVLGQERARYIVLLNETILKLMDEARTTGT